MSAARRAGVARAAVAILAILAAVALTACSPIEPWVKPYEREHLADPIMAIDRDPVSSSYLDHVYDSREGARGATGSVGGGCGCN
ncbi:MAG: DUF4266 domain-containing protein [Steroidobacteraceae bacterium]